MFYFSEYNLCFSEDTEDRINDNSHLTQCSTTLLDCFMCCYMTWQCANALLKHIATFKYNTWKLMQNTPLEVKLPALCTKVYAFKLSRISTLFTVCLKTKIMLYVMFV